MPVNAATSKRVGNDRILPDAHRLYASSCNPGRDSKTLHKRLWCHIDSIAEVDNQVLQVHTMYQREGRQAISCHPAQIAFAWTGRCPYYSSTTERQSRGCMTPLCWPGCPWQVFPARSLSFALIASERFVTAAIYQALDLAMAHTEEILNTYTRLSHMHPPLQHDSHQQEPRLLSCHNDLPQSPATSETFLSTETSPYFLLKYEPGSTLSFSKPAARSIYVPYTFEPFQLLWPLPHRSIIAITWMHA